MAPTLQRRTTEHSEIQRSLVATSYPYFYLFQTLTKKMMISSVMQLQNFYHQDAHKTVKKGRRPRTTDDPKESPKALQYYEATGVG